MEIRFAVDLGHHAVKTAASVVGSDAAPVTTQTPSLAWVGADGELRLGDEARMAAADASSHVVAGWMDRLFSLRTFGAVDGVEGAEGWRAADLLRELLVQPLTSTIGSLGIDPEEVDLATVALVVPSGWTSPQETTATRVVQESLEDHLPRAEVEVVPVGADEALGSTLVAGAGPGSVLALDVGSAGVAAHVVGPEGTLLSRRGTKAPGEDVPAAAAVVAAAGQDALSRLGADEVHGVERAVVVGGAASLPGLAALVGERLDLPTSVAAHPGHAAVLGALGWLEGDGSWWDEDSTGAVPMVAPATAAASSGPRRGRGAVLALGALLALALAAVAVKLSGVLDPEVAQTVNTPTPTVDAQVTTAVPAPTSTGPTTATPDDETTTEGPTTASEDPTTVTDGETEGSGVPVPGPTGTAPTSPTPTNPGIPVPVPPPTSVPPPWTPTPTQPWTPPPTTPPPPVDPPPTTPPPTTPPPTTPPPTTPPPTTEPPTTPPPTTEPPSEPPPTTDPPTSEPPARGRPPTPPGPGPTP